MPNRRDWKPGGLVIYLYSFFCGIIEKKRKEVAHEAKSIESAVFSQSHFADYLHELAG